MSTEPFPGLRPFRRNEADIFFGRESIVDEMVSRLAAYRFLAVTGTSGSGKSSLVFTGLLDALELGLLARAGSDWTIAQCRPGNRPLRALAESLINSTESERFDHDSLLLEAALSRGPAGLLQWVDEAHLLPRNNLLLLVDQFEELFRYRGVEIADTAGTDLDEARQRQAWEEAASAFVDVLVGAAAGPDRRIYVVLTMRSDYLGECAQFAGLAEAINRGQFLTPRLSREQLAEAVTGPVQVYGGAIEPALVNRVLNEMGNDPDQLPLMQHAMMRMWRRATSVQTGAVLLTERDYDDWIGGLKLALSAHASEVLHSLPEDDQALAQILFRSLTEGSTVADARRHPITLKEAADVAEVTPERLKAIVETFRAPGCDFLMPATGPLEPDTTIDISHESLIRQWDKLREWMGEEFTSAALWRRLSSAAADWENDETSPWVSPDIENALAWRERQAPNEAWARRYGGDLPQAFRFLEASRIEARRRRFGKFMPWFSTAAGVFLVVAVVAIVMAMRAGTAKQEALNAFIKLRQNEQELAALQAQQRIHGRVRAAQPEDLDLARQFALNALNMLRNDATTPAYPQLIQVLRDAYAIDYNTRLLVGSEHAKVLIVDPHGTRAAAVTDDGAVALWSVTTGLPGPRLSSDSRSATALAFSPNGTFLATAQQVVRVWDASSGEEVAHFTDQTAAEVVDLAVSIDGKRVLSLDKDGNAEVWDAVARSKVTTIACAEGSGNEQSDSGGDVGHVALRDDGKAGLVAWPDGRVAVWREGASPVCRTRERAASFVMFDGDDPVVVSDKLESLADVPPATFSGVTILGRLRIPVHFDGWADFTAHAGSHWTFQAISADGGIALARDISGSQNAPVYAFTPCTDCSYAGVMRGDVHAVAQASSAPRTAIASGRSVTVTGGGLPSKSYSFPADVLRVAISPDGESVAAIGDDAGWVWLKDAPAPKTLDGLRSPLSVSFSPDGKYLVTADASQNMVSVWNIQVDVPTATALAGHTDSVRQALFLSNDRIVSVSDDKTVRFWRLGTVGRQTGSEKQSTGTNPAEQKGQDLAADRAPSQSEQAAAQASVWQEELDLQIKIADEPGRLISVSSNKANGRLAILSSTGQVYVVTKSDAKPAKPDYRLAWPSTKSATAIEFTPDGAKLVIFARGADDASDRPNLVDGLQIVPLPIPGAVTDPADPKSSVESVPTFPYRGGIAFEDGSHILLATAEGLLRVDVNHPPKIASVPYLTDAELVRLSDLLIGNRYTPDELDQIGRRDDAVTARPTNAIEPTCKEGVEPCLRAVLDHPADPASWAQLAASNQAPQYLRSAATLVGAIEGDPGLAEQFVAHLSSTKSLGPPLSHWFLLGMIHSDQPVSARLVADLLASGPLTPAERDRLRTTFEARAAEQDAGADASLALVVLQGSPSADEKKQALKDLLISEGLTSDKRQDLSRAVLRANLVRASSAQDVLDVQTAAKNPAPSGTKPSQPATPAWSPNLTDVNLHTGLGQLKLLEKAFQWLHEKWPAEPKLDLLEALVRLELATDLLGDKSVDDQTRAAAREELAKALHQLAVGNQSLTQAQADAAAAMGIQDASRLRWQDALALAHNLESIEPELAARTYAYVVRVTGEAAVDERKISSDLVSAFQEAQHKLVGFIANGNRDDAVIEELAPGKWRWWIVGRKILNIDRKADDAAAYFSETAVLLRFLTAARPGSADLLIYLTDALDWYALAAIRNGSYESMPLAARIPPIVAAERLVFLDSETGQDRSGEAAEIFFNHIWSTTADGKTLFGTFPADLNVANLSDVMARVVQNDSDLLDGDSADHNAVLRNFIYVLGTVALAKASTTGPEQDCDRQASHPLDPWRTVPGVLVSDIKADAAIAACKTALEKSDLPRLNFELGRAYYRKAELDQANAAMWRQKSREVFVKALDRNYFPTLIAIAVDTYDVDSKQYKQVFLAAYAHYLVATARPIVAAMVADGSVGDHKAAARFLLEQAISFGDIDSELALAELIGNRTLDSNEPLERAIRARIALRLGSADLRKRAQAMLDLIKPSLSVDDQNMVESEANRFVADGMPALPDGMVNAFLAGKVAAPKSN